MKLYAQRLARQRYEQDRTDSPKISVEEASARPPRLTQREKRSTATRSNKSAPGHDRGLNDNAKDRAHAGARTAAGEDHAPGAAIVPVRRAISSAKLAANRRNALRSTGPRSALGKRRAAVNALKHGLCASPSLSPVLPGESEATFETIRQELRDEFHPRTAMESWIVEKIAQQLWRLMRAAEVERRLVALEERNLARAMADGAEDLPDDGTLPPAGELLARVLSAGESHPMMLLARYER